MRWSLPVTMTARVRRPFVASTSFVLPLALSMSRFTGSESSATIATICSATTTLPCPTFTRCVTDPLPPFARLFKILSLLAHLLDDPLGGERGLTELEVVRLRRDRVDLAIQLLDQEVQCPTGRAALVEEHRELLEVRAEPRHFFAHVGLVGPDGDLGEDPALVEDDLAEERSDPLPEPLPVPCERHRRSRRDHVHLRPEGGVQGAELGAEGRALRAARRDELVEGPAEHLGKDGPRESGGGRLRVLRAHDARALQHPRERHLTAQPHGTAELPRLGDVLRRERGVDTDLLRALAGCRSELNGPVDTTALEARLDHPTSVHLEGAERARKP